MYDKQICIGGRTYYTIENAKKRFKVEIELKGMDILINGKKIKIPVFVKDNNILVSLDDFFYGENSLKQSNIHIGGHPCYSLDYLRKLFGIKLKFIDDVIYVNDQSTDIMFDKRTDGVYISLHDLNEELKKKTKIL